ncbi:MAG: adenosylcobinamide-GDP ribazoletransferase [Atopobiaceae bacterium]|nr:adenosylcobinamide-GDP ribazoletransferase [Atopobiaceae bacterium]
MSLLRSVIIAFSCFSAIPMPQVEWNERNMHLMMAAFPLVGAVVGVCWWVWHLACLSFGTGQLMRAIGFALIPVAVTGGIHMDGFADVVDALSSHAAPERKREILKDPHIGAFAAMGIACYLLAYVALAGELEPRLMPIACAIPFVSRCCCGFIAIFAHASSSRGMMASIGETARRGNVAPALGCMLALACGYLLWYNVVVGLAIIAVAACILVGVLRMAQREFGGMSGDLLGFYVQVTEIATLATVVCTGRLVAL